MCNQLDGDHLAKAVECAFRNWHEPAAENPLSCLRIFWLAQHRGENADRAMLQTLLLDALDELKGSGKNRDCECAQVVHQRFIDRWPWKDIAEAHSRAIAGVFLLKNQAIKKLAIIIIQREAQAQAEYQTIMEVRLANRTYDKLFGVQAHLDELCRLVEGPATPQLTLLHGMGGQGKTTLADALLRRLMLCYDFDGVGWVSAHHQYFTLTGQLTSVRAPVANADNLIALLAKQILPASYLYQEHIIATEVEPALHQYLEEHRHLIVLDNLESLDNLDELIPRLQALAGISQFILTSRTTINHRAVYAYSISELSKAAALELVTHEAHLWHVSELTRLDDAQLGAIYCIVGGNPLALRLLVGQSRIFPLDVVLEIFQGAIGEGTENLYCFIFEQTWADLDDAKRQLLLCMLLTPEAGSPVATLMAISGLPRRNVINALTYLVTVNLVDRQGQLYRIHQLTRSYLSGLVGPDDLEEDGHE